MCCRHPEGGKFSDYNVKLKTNQVKITKRFSVLLTNITEWQNKKGNRLFKVGTGQRSFRGEKHKQTETT